jgi:uncharacterized membrane protein
MKPSKPALAAAIGGLFVLNFAASAFADEATAPTEKCYGVAKAGKNDCAGKAHACSGQAKKDGSATDFLKLPAGTCDRLVGGKHAPTTT